MPSRKDNLILKNRLREARSACGLSQTELARLAGVSRQTTPSIETGQPPPTAKLALTLAIAPNRTFEELFHFED